MARIAVATALPVRDAPSLTKLLRAKLETVDPGFGIEVTALAAEAVAPLGRRRRSSWARPMPPNR